MVRLLYVDILLTHINPTATYFPLLIERAVPQVTFYGPGFSAPNELAKGLSHWIRETGPYDAIIVGPNSPIIAEKLDGELIRGTLAYMRRSTAHSHTDADLVQFLKDLFLALPTVEIEHRLIVSTNFDYYAATEQQVDRLYDLNATLIGPNDQFIRPLHELPEFVTREKHYQRKIDRISDCWYDFVKSHPERVITALHYVVPSEFFYSPIASRRPVVAVPGVEYHLRKEANSRLRESGAKRASKTYFQLFRMLNHLRVPVYGTVWGLRLYNHLFQQTLRTSRYVYTARGGFGLPVRKFFEIPAAGALMLCSPCTGYQDLGFTDGMHYYAVEPDDLPNVLRELIRSGAGGDVATSGRKITAKNHSLEARAEQVALCIGALVKGTYLGSTWKQGEFTLKGVQPVEPLR